MTATGASWPLKNLSTISAGVRAEQAGQRRSGWPLFGRAYVTVIAASRWPHPQGSSTSSERFAHEVHRRLRSMSAATSLSSTTAASSSSSSIVSSSNSKYSRLPFFGELG